MALFEIEGLDELVSAMDMVSQVYPKEVKKFMQKEGTKLRNRTVKTAKSSVGRKTGNFLKGIKRGKYYKFKGNGADIFVRHLYQQILFHKAKVLRIYGNLFLVTVYI